MSITAGFSPQPDYVAALGASVGGAPVPPLRVCTAIDHHHVHLPAGVTPDEAISMNGKLWTPGDTIGFGFLDGSATQRAKAQKWIEYWLQVVNLHFQFGAAHPDVRITFAPGGSWSLIGTDCRLVPQGPTMQFGWVTDSTDDQTDRAVIVHEAGHLLGLGHEQSSPLEDIRWNKPRALAYYMSTQGWTAQMVEDNVFAVFDAGQVTGTAYDRASIMQYPVPAQLTLDGRGIAWNTDLSPLDRQYAATMYPGAAPTPPVTPTTPVVPPPVVPPVPPPPALPMVVIGHPAVSVPIPAAGSPAQFGLSVPATQVLDLGVAIGGAYGREPLVLVTEPGTDQATLRLGLVHGRGLFRFDAGFYVLQVWNANPALAGTAWVKVTPR